MSVSCAARKSAGRWQSPRADHMDPRQGYLLAPALQKLFPAQGECLLPGLAVCIELAVIPLPKRHPLSVKAHQARIFERPAPHVARQGGRHAAALPVPLGNADIPLRAGGPNPHAPHPLVIAGGGSTRCPVVHSSAIAPSPLPPNSARTTATGNRYPFPTVRHWPAASSPPPPSLNRARAEVTPTSGPTCAAPLIPPAVPPATGDHRARSGASPARTATTPPSLLDDSTATAQASHWAG